MTQNMLRQFLDHQKARNQPFRTMEMVYRYLHTFTFAPFYR